ncbi:uncharacterized protein LACBIDRAFT_322527 [Laccaria bicolor S238N-H82]|uniref:Predicted protein n=1 Tax=Laccaria bicolor (strain S238N-H82 / ATCC MYA-4686) TaxID=486041 RepID=B0CWL5_LACBS|nr:uncharacterized protein LACBIDRAFT_322527 [Laccaria bicolor S238N-H82]EDR13086.1 predicted protein [Laccaria bicolor S238N-H82]|eukprot:XP_001875584.1 predicted protein [Laccaria bicolor S238N-H82]
MKDFHLSYTDFMLVQPSDNTIRDWNPSLGRACTADDFRPDFYSSPKSSWNKSVTEVFVESFLDADTFSSHDVAAVRRAFGARLKSLRRSMNVARMSHSDYLDLQAKARRDERKRTMPMGSHADNWQLFSRRINAAIELPELAGEHVHILQRLGVDGMSTDESDHELIGTGIPQFRIRKKGWRDERLGVWLRKFDALHRFRRFAPIRRAGPGAQPRIRLISNVSSTRPPVPGLPFNAYNANWLQHLPSWGATDLEVDSRRYCFQFNPQAEHVVLENSGRLDTIGHYP